MGYRALAVVTALSLIFVEVSPAYSAESGGCSGKVSNVSFTVSGLTVEVRYDLLGDPDATYNVSLTLRNHSDPSFRYSPKSLSGDIGMGKYAGKGRKIFWDMSKEFPRGLQGSGYYFLVNVQKVESGHSTNLLAWIGAGAVAVAAAVTYVIVMHNGGPTSAASYPAPPGRP